LLSTSVAAQGSRRDRGRLRSSRSTNWTRIPEESLARADPRGQRRPCVPPGPGEDDTSRRRLPRRRSSGRRRPAPGRPEAASAAPPPPPCARPSAARPRAWPSGGGLRRPSADPGAIPDPPAMIRLPC